MLVIFVSTRAHADDRVPVILYKTLELSTSSYLPIADAVLRDLRVRKVQDASTFVVGEIKLKDFEWFEARATTLGVGFSIRADFFQVDLPGADVDVDTGLPSGLPEHLLFSASHPADVWVVQFVGPLTEEQRLGLEAEGFSILLHIDQNAALVTGPANRFSTTIASLPAIRGAFPYHPALRIAPDLTPASASPAGTTKTVGEVRKELLLLGSLPPEPLVALLPTYGIKAISGIGRQGYLNVVWASGLTEAFESLAFRAEVWAIAPYPTEVLSDEKANLLLAGRLGAPDDTFAETGNLRYREFLKSASFCNGCLADYSIGGKPAILVVQDTGLDIDAENESRHPDFRAGQILGRKVFPYYGIGAVGAYTAQSGPSGIPSLLRELPGDCHGHGTMVASVAAAYQSADNSEADSGSDAKGFRYNDGIAPGLSLFAVKRDARCVHFTSRFLENYPAARATATELLRLSYKEEITNQYEGVGGWRDAYVEQFGESPRFVTNSWDIDATHGVYSSETQLMDKLARSDTTDAGGREVFLTFAAGNRGKNGDAAKDFVMCGTGSGVGRTWTPHNSTQWVNQLATARNVMTVGGSAPLRDYADFENADTATFEERPTWSRNGAQGTNPATDRVTIYDHARFGAHGTSQIAAPYYKPDITAPAVRVVSAKSQNVNWNNYFGDPDGSTDRKDYLDGEDGATSWRSTDPLIGALYGTAPGTSFSSPAVAASAVLFARFLDFHLRRGVSETHVDFSRVFPSPDLLKAGLIAHAQSMAGGRDTWVDGNTESVVDIKNAQNQSTCPADPSTLLGNLWDEVRMNPSSSVEGQTEEDRLPNRPSRVQGWGHLNFAASAGGIRQGAQFPAVVGMFDSSVSRFIANDTILDQSVETSDPPFVSYCLTVDESDRPTAIVLSWLDAPQASPPETPALQNDLNLLVYDPPSTSTPYRGNCIDPATGYSRTTCIAFDSSNNVEAVFLAPGAPRSIRVDITTGLLQGDAKTFKAPCTASTKTPCRQDFGLYVANAVDSTASADFRWECRGPNRLQLFASSTGASGGSGFQWTFDRPYSCAFGPGCELTQNPVVELSNGVTNVGLTLTTACGAVATSTQPVTVEPGSRGFLSQLTPSHGPIGTEVEVSGDDIPESGQDEYEVWVSAPCSAPVFVEPTSMDPLVFRIPPMCLLDGVVEVSVRIAGACPGWVSLPFVITVPGQVTAVPSSGSVAGGTTLELYTASNAGCGFDVSSASQVVVAGVGAFALLSASAEKLVVETGATSIEGVGDVIVNATTCAGTMTKPNGFEYILSGFATDARGFEGGAVAVQTFRSGPEPSSTNPAATDGKTGIDGSSLPSAVVPFGGSDVAVVTGPAGFLRRYAVVEPMEDGTIHFFDSGSNQEVGAVTSSCTDRPYWSPRRISVDPTGVLAYVIHQPRNTPGFPRVCGFAPADGSGPPITLLNLDTAADDYSISGVSIPSRGEIDTYQLESKAWIHEEANTALWEGLPYVEELSSPPRLRRRYLFVSSSWSPLPCSDCRMAITVYDLNPFIFHSSGATSNPGYAPNGVIHSSVALEDFSFDSSMTGSYELGFDIGKIDPSTSGPDDVLYAVSPNTGRIVRVLTADLIANTPNPLYITLPDPGSLPSDVVIVRNSIPPLAGQQRAFVSLMDSNEVVAYRVDPGDGSLTVPVVSPTDSLGVAPTATDGRITDQDRVFTANSGSGDVSRLSTSTLEGACPPSTQCSPVVPIGANSQTNRLAVQPKVTASGLVMLIDAELRTGEPTDFSSPGAKSALLSQLACLGEFDESRRFRSRPGLPVEVAELLRRVELDVLDPRRKAALVRSLRDLETVERQEKQRQ